MKNYISILLMMNFFSHTANAQVGSTTYRLMLNTLLSHSVKEVSVKELMSEKNVVLLDARAEKEFKVSHIKDAVYVGYDDFNLSRVKHLPKNKKIVVYCSVGYRSEKIAEQLKAAGYTDVANLYGGMFEWVNQGQAVVNSEQKPTKKVHAFSKTWGIWLNKGEKVYD